jgi:CBS domain-containing protein
MLIEEIISGMISGAMYGLISSVFIILLSVIFKYFTGESFPWFLSVAVGLGIVGISGGLLALLDEPTPLSVARIMVASMILVLATNEGNKLGSRLPRKQISLLSSLRALGRENLTTIRIPDEQDINDIPGKPRVGIGVKRRLAGTEFLLPADLSREELENRIKRRLLADWRLGDTELETDQRGRLTYLAVSALKHGLSGSLREGSLALPMKYDAAPAGLAPGDLVRVYSGSELLMDSAEVKGVDEDNRTVTLVLKAEDLQNCVDKEATRVVALPRAKRGMLVEEIMTREMCTVTPDTSLREAISLMNERRVGSVVVTENGRAVGILTDRDVLQRVVKGRLNTKSKVEDVMSEPVVEIPPDLPVDEAVTVMRTRNVKNLPVTSRGRLVGMITSDDISRATSVVT